MLRSIQGNVALIFALMAPVLFGVAGATVDFTSALLLKAHLQDALDSASVGSISVNSNAYKAATTMLLDGPIPVGNAQAQAIFNANLAPSAVSGVTLQTNIVKTGSNLNSSIAATASYNTIFGGFIGISKIPLYVSSTAINSLPLFRDFYLLLDVSGSMGLPSTDSEETRLAAVNPDNRADYPAGCTFACHFSGFQGYQLSRNGGNAHNIPVSSCPTPGTSACIQLRLDAVGFAVNQLLSVANSSQQVPKQYRVGLYPFIAKMYPYYPVTSNLTGSPTDPTTINYAAANLANLLDSGVNIMLGSGGTHFENALPGISSAITVIGNGVTSLQPQPWVFFVTDGSQDFQQQWNGSWWGSNHATTLTPSLCTNLKNRGINIAVLYIPYQQIQNPTTFAGSEDFYANANIPNIAAPLQSCASDPSFYKEADSPADITNQLQQIFYQATRYDRVSK